MHHQVTDIVQEKLPHNRQAKDDREVKSETPAADLSCVSIAEDLAVEVSDGTAEIAKAISVWRLSLDKKDIDSLASVVREESKRYGYDWKLILAIIRTESQFNARAKSHKGARGLMQVMPSTAKWLSPQLGLAYKGRDSLYDPKYNVRLGTHYLRMMHKKFGNIEKAIVAYNRGPSGLERYLRQGRKFPPEYLVIVMGYFEELANSAAERAG